MRVFDLSVEGEIVKMGRNLRDDDGMSGDVRWSVSLRLQIDFVVEAGEEEAAVGVVEGGWEFQFGTFQLDGTKRLSKKRTSTECNCSVGETVDAVVVVVALVAQLTLDCPSRNQFDQPFSTLKIKASIIEMTLFMVQHHKDYCITDCDMILRGGS